MQKYNKYLQLAFALALTLGVGFVGNLATQDQITNWYAGLEKPFFTPPNDVFGPVWTTLYIIIGVSLYMIIRSSYKDSKFFAYLAFGSQLLLNLSWSLVFFGLESLAGGMAVILLLVLAIIWNIKEFYKINKKASYLFVPYLLWVLYATALTAGVMLLNS